MGDLWVDNGLSRLGGVSSHSFLLTRSSVTETLLGLNLGSSEDM